MGFAHRGRRRSRLLSLVTAGTLLVATAAAAGSAPKAANAAGADDLLIVSAKEMAGIARVGELVRIPVILDDADNITSFDQLIVSKGGVALDAQATDLVSFPSGNLKAANVYVSDDFAADAETFYTVSRTTVPHTPAADVLVDDTDPTTVTVTTDDLSLGFARAGTATPGAITALSSTLVDVGIRSGAVGPGATVRLTDIASRGANDDVESGTTSPTGWTSQATGGPVQFAWSTAKFKHGTRSLEIAADPAAPDALSQVGRWGGAAIPATAGDRYRLEGFIKADGVVAGGAAATNGARWGLRFTGAGGAVLQESFSDSLVGSSTTAGWRNGEWKQVATPAVTAPAGTTAVRMFARLQGTGTAWFDYASLAHSQASTAAFANTSATQQTVSLDTETGPLFAKVTVTNQQLRSGTPVAAFQTVSYLIPAHGDYLEQETSYRGSLTAGDTGTDTSAYYALRGKIDLGADGATGDSIANYSIALTPSMNAADVKPALVDAANGIALLPVGSAIGSVQRIDRSGADPVVSVVAAAKPTGLDNVEMQTSSGTQRDHLRYALSDTTDAEALRVLGLRHANPVVGIVDRFDASFDADLVPLISQLLDQQLALPSGSRAESTTALAAYITWELTGLASYKTQGDAIVASWFNATRQTTAYWEAQFTSGGYGILDPQISSLYYLSVFNSSDAIWKVAHAVGVAAKNKVGFVDDDGQNQIASSGRSAARNMVLSVAPSYLWGAIKAGDTATRDFYLDVLDQPGMHRYTSATESPYMFITNGAAAAASDAHALYYYADASYFRNAELASGGTLDYDNRAARAAYTAVEVDHEGYGADSTGWLDLEKAMPASSNRWMYANTYMLALKSTLDEATDARTGITDGARWLQRYLDLLGTPVSDDRGIDQRPIYLDPEISAEFNARGWGASNPSGAEFDSPNGLNNTVRHIVDLYMVHEHAGDIS